MTELLIGALPSEPVLLTPDRLASAELMLFKLEDKNITPKRKVNVWQCMPTRKPMRGAVSARQVIAVKFLGPEACDYLIFHMWPVGNSVSSAGKKSRFWPHEIFPYFFSVAWSLLFFNMTRIDLPLFHLLSHSLSRQGKLLQSRCSQTHVLGLTNVDKIQRLFFTVFSIHFIRVPHFTWSY